ncbi:hypothetical protein BIW11_03259 [Tropilaelaps mercedesae]|uniref:Uncharacterized protein n=1 Tax=Tropilaelaps mercedesae TaxID=418985 RepID=A0A1V9XPN5_9ACAR|nr:hypothetical protein BIW11_03259 [Tropilaelaps mercedesae]
MGERLEGAQSRGDEVAGEIGSACVDSDFSHKSSSPTVLSRPNFGAITQSTPEVIR